MAAAALPAGDGGGARAVRRLHHLSAPCLPARPPLSSLRFSADSMAPCAVRAVNEKLTHGTWPWRGASERRSFFLKYCGADGPTNIGRDYSPTQTMASAAVSAAARELLRPLPPGSWQDPASAEVMRAREEWRRGGARL